ncbi:hypothetical protein [Streptomyces chryseus]|uniref:hypothetical protein n=1 Tax=Streptomyces chryseus TaxID=68186 RepID=UPI00110FA2BA|nr:hypothetical protein [Streptomyces chryseus]GGX19683.1 hypothetical protein GCM10010353_38450 [Streptomyces chryseus]
MSRDRTRPLTRQLLRIGHTAGQGATGGQIRFVALACATLALAVTFAVMAATWATYEEREARGSARSPQLRAMNSATGSPQLLWKGTGDSIGDRQFEVVHIAPLTTNAPLPPGLDHWPAPGEAVLSPALLAEGSGEGIRDRYGRYAGEIGADGLASPGERLAYVRPADGALTKQNAYPVYGFGLPAPWALGDLALVRPLPVFLSLLAVFLLLPAGLLTVVAARLGATGRDRRTALLGALGASRRQVALLSLGEAGRPVLLGTALAVPLAALGLLFDLRLPWTGYLVAAADLRAHAGVLTAGLLAAPVLVAAAVVCFHPPSGQGRSTRPLGGARSRLVKVAAGLCPLFLLILSWFPATAGRSEARTAMTLVLMAGIVGTLATLPAVIALLISAAGRAVAALGRRRGAPGTLLAGRWTVGRPGYLARLVAGVVIAVGLLCVVQVYPSMSSAFVQGARDARAELGFSMLTVEAQSASAERVDQWLRAVPPGTRAVGYTSTLDPVDVGSADSGSGGSESGSRSTTGTAGATGSSSGDEIRLNAVLRGECPVLATLGLPCPRAEGASLDVPVSSAAPAARRLLSGVGPAGEVTVVRGSPTGGEKGAVMVLVSSDGRDLPLYDLKRTARAQLGPLTAVDPLGQAWIGGAQLVADQLRWVPLLGTMGVVLVALSAALNNLAEIMRFARAIAPLSVLSGSRRVYAAVAAWTLMVPLCVAAVWGVIGGVWITLPFTVPPRNGVLPGATLALVVAVLVALSGVLAAIAARGAVREAERWRPQQD